MTVFTCIVIGAVTPVAGNTIHVDSPVQAWPRDALVELHTTELREAAGSARANRHRLLATANAVIFARSGLSLYLTLIDLEVLLSFVDRVIALPVPVTAVLQRYCSGAEVLPVVAERASPMDGASTIISNQHTVTLSDAKRS